MHNLTPKQHVLLAEPQAKLDYYETLRRANIPCWFIRIGRQGAPLSEIAENPRAAWLSAYVCLLKAMRQRGQQRRKLAARRARSVAKG